MGRVEGPAHADHVLKVIAGNDAASSALAASWRRSGALHALDPASIAPSQRLPEEEIARSRERMGSLLGAAQASIDRLFLAVGGVGCSVVLADPRGIIVDRRGAPCDDTLFDSSGLWTGAVWGERYEGTNGIGTCIVEHDVDTATLAVEPSRVASLPSADSRSVRQMLRPSTMPATSGTSGPTTTKPIRFSVQKRTTAPWSATSRLTHSATSAMPALPGAQ